jgi:hypothetical protein
VKTFRAIIWSEDQIPNTDPRDRDRLPVVAIRSREIFFIQTRNQADAAKQFKAFLGQLAAEK